MSHVVDIEAHLTASLVRNGTKRAVVPNTVCCFQRYSRGTVRCAVASKVLSLVLNTGLVPYARSVWGDTGEWHWLATSSTLGVWISAELLRLVSVIETMPANA